MIDQPHPCGCLYEPHPESEGLRVCTQRCPEHEALPVVPWDTEAEWRKIAWPLTKAFELLHPVIRQFLAATAVVEAWEMPTHHQREYAIKREQALSYHAWQLREALEVVPRERELPVVSEPKGDDGK